MARAYWRLYVAATRGKDYFQVTEVAFLDGSGADLTVGGVASASSEYGPTYSAAKAFDKSTATDYCTAIGQVPAWLQYTFASAVDVASVQIRWASSASYLPVDDAAMRLMSSADGTKWIDVYSLSLVSGGLTENTVATAAATPLPGSLASVISPSAAVVFSAPMPAPTMAALVQAVPVRDIDIGGAGTIYGTTKTKGTPSNTPAKARVVLLHQRSKQPVRETWSDPVTGGFAFTGIDINQQFLTLAEDAAGNFRPVAASRLVPEVLP